MSDFDWGPLRNTVLGAIERGQIGRPVSLRLTVHGSGGDGERRDLEGELRGLASAWFGGLWVSEYVTGGDCGPSVLALKWSGGQSAILSVSTGAGQTGGNLVLLGSNGAIYHDIGPTALSESVQTDTGGVRWPGSE